MFVINNRHLSCTALIERIQRVTCSGTKPKQNKNETKKKQKNLNVWLLF